MYLIQESCKLSKVVIILIFKEELLRLPFLSDFLNITGLVRGRTWTRAQS